MSKETKVVVISHLVEASEEKKLKSCYLQEGYELAIKVTDYEKRETLYKFTKQN